MMVHEAPTRDILQFSRFYVHIPSTGTRSPMFATYPRALEWAEDNTPLGDSFIVYGERVQTTTLATGVC